MNNYEQKNEEPHSAEKDRARFFCCHKKHGSDSAKEPPPCFHEKDKLKEKLFEHVSKLLKERLYRLKNASDH